MMDPRLPATVTQEEIDALCADFPAQNSAAANLRLHIEIGSITDAYQLLAEAAGDFEAADSPTCWDPIEFGDIRRPLCDLLDEMDNWPDKPSALFERRSAQIMWAIMTYMRETIQ